MKTIWSLIVGIGMASAVFGQNGDLEIVSSAGASFQANNLSLNWTLGEMIVDFMDESEVMVSQGFHQPGYQIVSVKSIPVDLGVIAVFPNPFSDELMIKMSFTEAEKGELELLDTKGTSVWKKSFEGHDLAERYPATALPSGSYLLVVSLTHHASVQSYQLLKTQ